MIRRAAEEAEAREVDRILVVRFGCVREVLRRVVGYEAAAFEHDRGCPRPGQRAGEGDAGRARADHEHIRVQRTVALHRGCLDQHRRRLAMGSHADRPWLVAMTGR